MVSIRFYFLPRHMPHKITMIIITLNHLRRHVGPTNASHNGKIIQF